MNPFYNAMNKNNPMQMLQQLRANPMQFLMERKFNVPQDMANDPQKITNYLVQSGQISQEAYNKAVQAVQQMGMKR